jgi:hypothetical protein
MIKLVVTMYCKAGSGAVFRLMRCQGKCYELDGDLYELQLLEGSSGSIGDKSPDVDLMELRLVFFPIEFSSKSYDFNVLSKLAVGPLEFELRR